jgi:signal recognition particle receptor subunit alpha
MIDNILVIHPSGIVALNISFLTSNQNSQKNAIPSFTAELIDSHLLNRSSPQAFGKTIAEWTTNKEGVMVAVSYGSVLKGKVDYVSTVMAEILTVYEGRTGGGQDGGEGQAGERWDEADREDIETQVHGIVRHHQDKERERGMGGNSGGNSDWGSNSKGSGKSNGGGAGGDNCGDKGKGSKKKMGVAEVGKKLSAKQRSALDFSSGEVDNGEGPKTFVPTKEEEVEWNEEIEEEQNSKASWFGSAFKGALDSAMNNKTLTNDDLEPALEKISSTLIKNNVNPEVADKIMETVKGKLEGAKGGWNTETIVRDAVEEALERILQGSGSVDILSEALSCAKRPYKIAFCGINGVGKTTTIAKVAWWMKRNGLKVRLAACDTFRSGAVEQLKVHGKAVGVEVTDKGYSKDPTGVALEGERKCREEKEDVLLIDTAGRMQSNAPLLNALVKLVRECKPDRVIFVGEALAGNDGLDQMTVFDKALQTGGKGVDAVILTKYDTVSGKVGAVLNMSYEGGRDVVMVGTGQKYHMLKKVSTGTVVKALFSVW